MNQLLFNSLPPCFFSPLSTPSFLWLVDLFFVFLDYTVLPVPPSNFFLWWFLVLAQILVRMKSSVSFSPACLRPTAIIGLVYVLLSKFHFSSDLFFFIFFFFFSLPFFHCGVLLDPPIVFFLFPRSRCFAPLP